jgi:hypothetical protein
MPPCHHRPSSAAPTSHRIALRLQAGVDADLLAAQLRELCTAEPSPSGRAPPLGGSRQTAVALSVVETCGRSRAARERDALRLVELESRDCDDLQRSDSPREPLRATLVSVDTFDHFLLLDAPLARGRALLEAITTGLGQFYPVAALVLV